MPIIGKIRVFEIPINELNIFEANVSNNPLSAENALFNIRYFFKEFTLHQSYVQIIKKVRSSFNSFDN